MRICNTCKIDILKAERLFMNCPKCNTEVKENQKFCAKCGAAINNVADSTSSKVAINDEAVTKKRNIVIASLSLFLVILVSTIFFIVRANASEVLTYKSITPVEQSQIKAMTSRSALELMIQQDADMFEFMSKPMHGNSDKLFEVFYNNLLNLCRHINVDDVAKTSCSDSYDFNSCKEILTPNTELVRYSINNWSGIWVDVPYIEKRYSKFLNSKWKEYLKLKTDSKIPDMELGYYNEDKNVISEVIAWQNFSSKYPDFMKENIKSDLKFLTTYIMYQDNSSGNFIVKSAYDEFLNKVNQNTEEYKVVKRCHDVLEKNNFEANSEFFKCIADWNQSYIDLYENAKVWEEQHSLAGILKQINELQARYFSIIKRNDMLLQLTEYEGYENDRADLSNLYNELENKIDQDNYYFKKYREIEKKYANNPGMTTYDMDMFASEHYEAVDKLLNEVYQVVKGKIPQEDFKNLTASELKWIRDVGAYRKVFEAQGFGTIGGVVGLGYQTNMHSFRTLLLMLYLN